MPFAPQTRRNEPIYSSRFHMTCYGGFPDGWHDQVAARPNPNWIVDGNHSFRPVAKRKVGLATYHGYLSDGTSARLLADARVRVVFAKTTEPECVFGVAVRVQDARNYYLARYLGDRTLQWVIVADGQETIAAETTDLQPLDPIERGQQSLEVAFQGDRLTVRRSGPATSKRPGWISKTRDLRKGPAASCRRLTRRPQLSKSMR